MYRLFVSMVSSTTHDVEHQQPTYKTALDTLQARTFVIPWTGVLAEDLHYITIHIRNSIFDASPVAVRHDYSLHPLPPEERG